MGNSFVFDQPHYDPLNASREEVIRGLLASLRDSVVLKTALDVGCGVGHFSSFIKNMGFEVLGLDGRPENVREAERRCPGIEFRVVDAEDRRIQSVGKFDLVLFLGIFYHLENPFTALRNLVAMTGKVAILEGMCHASSEPILAVRDEPLCEDQGLHHVALYPSENGLIKLLYRSGFAFVYKLKVLPAHPEYRKSSLRERTRTMLVASTIPLPSERLDLAAEPPTNPDPWARRNTPAAVALRVRDSLVRLGRFTVKPWREKRLILG